MRQYTTMNKFKYHSSGSSGGSGAPIDPAWRRPGLASGAPDQPIIYYFIPDLMCFLYNPFYFSIIFIIGGRWW